MNTKEILLLISHLSIIGLFSLSYNSEANAAKQKTHKGQLERQKKLYTVPGSVAISSAKRHGYLFSGSSTNQNDRRKRTCEFTGMHWTVYKNSTCDIRGFYLNRNPRHKSRKCSKLRKEWKIKEIKLKGNYVWKYRPSSTNRPSWRATSKNTSSKAQVVLIQSVTFEGPIGANNSWQEAFSHCSDSSYRD